MTEMKTTAIGNSYWDGTGVYQKAYDALYEEMVPKQGAAHSLQGELIRAVSRLYYEWCNNGNCNACDQHYRQETTWESCWECGGSGDCEDEECEECGGSGDCEVTEDVIDYCTVSPFYLNFLKLIKESIPESTAVIYKIEAFIEGNHYSSRNQFSDNNYSLYNEMADKVVFWVMNNSKLLHLPKWYEESNN